MKPPRLSVVVPTYRRPRLLRRCLRALSGQKLSAADYEIVVVDDGHSNAIRDLVERLARQTADGPALRYRRPPQGRRGPAAARNAGWRAARGDIVAFTDDDTIPAADWLRHGLQSLTPGVDAAWGKVVVPLPERPTDAQRNTAGLDGAEFVTANCFVRRTVLAALGGFDERFTRAWREDSDFYFTLIEHGCAVADAPAAVVVHPARKAPPGTCLKQHLNLVFDALLYKKHRRLYRQKIAAGPPWRYYFTVAALLLALGAALDRMPLLAVSAAALWLALTAALAWRRLRGTSTVWADRADVILTSAAIPVLAVFWRLAGAVRFRVLFA